MEDLQLLPNTSSVNEVEFADGASLHFFARLVPSDTLYVAFHGAMRVDHDTYPRFERVNSLSKRSSTFLSFADPTWHLNPHMNLSWFLGGPDWDALDPIERVVRRALDVTGAKSVVFVGGSGGGFAALRIGIRFPGSLAYVQSPQTVITRYLPSTVDLYFESVWGEPKIQVVKRTPHKFDLTGLYRTNPGVNFVYYLQNLNDPAHIRDHYRPFKRIHGISEAQGTSRDAMKRFYISDSELLRHGPPTSSEFELNFSRAIQFHQAGTGTAKHSGA
ncbi:hypothetical protein [Pseudarthrobacter raffinosi]|uniref:hypothetical protein n=1 Tax=Pseudarthrobacter raffinosi TaxID=2953651 RepID=UPI00208E926C|nr:hypothetical protein [Pseudarthrobacter sp. MDT3-28]MCO4238656.1 hypothetical protein [Pseudarthrobacter sp. MDT3-28]